jgi:PHD/YefM family antitoxin component YafN of YafNO toxin-antitoxin module
MTRIEAIAAISAAVERLDDTQLAAVTDAVTEMSKLGTKTVLTVADVIRDMADDEAQLRRLSARELDLVAQSRADFAAGRTHSVDEAFAIVDTRLAARRARL